MRHRLLLVAVVGVAALAACSSDSDDFQPGATLAAGTTAPATTEAPSTTITSTTAPVDSTEATTSAGDLTSTTTESATTVAQPSATEPPMTIADDGLADTPQADGFDFPPADLQTDPDSPNNNRVIEPEHEPIIEAYLAVFEAELTTFSRWPLEPESPELSVAPLASSVRSAYVGGLAERTQLNQVLDILGGLTSRPYVIDDDDGDPDRVTVWDCQVDATFWKDVDTGEKAQPDAYPNAGPPGVELGSFSVLVVEDGRWVVESGGLEPRACS